MNYRSVGNFKTYLFKASFISVSLCTDLLEAFLIKYTNRMITGKNNKQFEEWYRLENKYDYVMISTFMSLPFEMQLGVYLAYYDFIEYRIDISSQDIIKDFKPYTEYLFKIFTDSGTKVQSWEGFKTRKEAYKEAFKQADKLINK